MVEVFKTNVRKKVHSKWVLTYLTEIFPSYKFNIDLSDCDKVLRVEGENIATSQIIALVKCVYPN